MGIFYILSLIVLVFGFLILKKSDEKLNLIKWLFMMTINFYMIRLVIT